MTRLEGWLLGVFAAFLIYGVASVFIMTRLRIRKVKTIAWTIGLGGWLAVVTLSIFGFRFGLAQVVAFAVVAAVMFALGYFGWAKQLETALALAKRKARKDKEE